MVPCLKTKLYFDIYMFKNICIFEYNTRCSGYIPNAQNNEHSCKNTIILEYPVYAQLSCPEIYFNICLYQKNKTRRGCSLFRNRLRYTIELY